MNLIVCVDNQNGMSFNNRRQSRDRAVIEKICDMLGGVKAIGRALNYGHYSRATVFGRIAFMQTFCFNVHWFVLLNFMNVLNFGMQNSRTAQYLSTSVMI